MNFLYQPTKPFGIYQGFGESRLCYNKDTKQIVGKTNGLCPVGFVSYYESVGMKGHSGLDLWARRWQPIYASADGIVEEVQTEVERGLGVGIITHKQVRFYKDCGEFHFAKYRNWHFIALNVEKGQKIEIGDLLGWADSTGFSTGDHDHFEVKAVDRFSDGTYGNAHQNNGYYGAVDPLHYLYDKYALDVKTTLQRIAEQLARIAEQVADLLRNWRR